VSASEYWPGQQRGAAGSETPVDETAVEHVVLPAVSEDTEDFDDPELDPDEDEDTEEDVDDDDGGFEDDDVEDAASAEVAPEPDEPAAPMLRLAGHAPGDLDIPDGIAVLEGAPLGSRRGVGIVAARFNGEVTNRLLESAFAELERAGVGRELITVMPVPGAFELPLGAMALAKTRRYACIVALGCVIRGETAHFDYVAGEAASGLQLAALETGVPVAFGVLTVDTLEQATARADKGAEAVRTALEMADLFAQLRASAKTA